MTCVEARRLDASRAVEECGGGPLIGFYSMGLALDLDKDRDCSLKW